MMNAGTTYFGHNFDGRHRAGNWRKGKSKREIGKERGIQQKTAQKFDFQLRERMLKLNNGVLPEEKIIKDGKAVAKRAARAGRHIGGAAGDRIISGASSLIKKFF